MFDKIKNIHYKYFLWMGLVLLILIGFVFFVINSVNMVYKSDHNIFAYTVKVQKAYEELDQIFERAEVNTTVLVESISNSYDTSKQQDKAYNLHFIKEIDSLVKSVLSNSPGADGCWFQLNADLPFSIQAYNWYEFRNDQFINLKNELEGRQITPDEDPYYFDAINNQKPIWSNIYTDADTKAAMMTISAPIYKDGILVGVTGIDISTDNLQQVLEYMQSILGDSEIYLLNKNNTVILAQLPDNQNAVKESYSFLGLFSGNEGGPIEYKDNLTKKTAIMLTLSNGYKIVISIKNNVLFSGTNRLFSAVYILIILLAILTIIILIKQHILIPLGKTPKSEGTKSQEDET